VKLYLIEPSAPDERWAPFAGVRPIAELRAGILRIRERWERMLGVPADGIIGHHVEGFADIDHPPVLSASAITGPAWVADATFAPQTGTTVPPGAARLTHGDRPVAWLLGEGDGWSGPRDVGPDAPVEGLTLAGSADLLDGLTDLLPNDAAWFVGQAHSNIPDGSIVLGSASDVVLNDAVIEPGVVFDTRRGPVVVDGAEVRHGTRLEGPVYIGRDSVILGGFIRRSVIGPQCRIRGEVSSTIFVGYANKAHDGFVGDSIVGHWANLGALTTTSNLKNTYGPVRLDAEGESWDTGRQFLGSLIGDHAKTAIGTMLGTGTIIGAGANVFGSDAVPKYVPAFAWGGTTDTRTRLKGFLKVAARVMPRRGVEYTPERRQSLERIYARANAE
jgi:UDP-N-acetylglucosamine diphosphorylase/glucosamine-1-phosphate N-acetyltransferase